MLGYSISHDSHHKENILLTLKQSGEKIPDTVKWVCGNGENKNISPYLLILI